MSKLALCDWCGHAKNAHIHRYCAQKGPPGCYHCKCPKYEKARHMVVIV